MRRLTAWILVVIGVGLVAAPFAFGMWTRAPRGAEMISDFRPYMTQTRAAQYEDDYLPSIAVGFGSVPDALSAAAAHDGHATWSYSDAATFLRSHPQLHDLSTVQQDFPTMATPFSTMVGVMVRDAGAFNGVAGLPPFWLFPFFFVIPGVVLLGVGVVLLRRERPGAQPQRIARRVGLVLGLGLALAPFLPMPPGWGLMWTAAPPGAHIIDDFGAPATGVAGTPAIMSTDTATLFGGYLDTMHAADAEIVPAVQAVAAQYGHSLSAADARAFIDGDPRLAQVAAILDRFPTMEASFRGMLTVMRRDVPDYQAVAALPPFTLFPFFFLVPGLLAAAAAGPPGLLRRAPRRSAAGSSAVGETRERVVDTG